METHEVRYFLAAARALNFTKAASAFSVSQPALTRAIKKLEAEFGGPLFHRHPSGMALTQLGRALLPRLEEVERGLDSVLREAEAITKEIPNVLRLGVMCTVGPMHVTSLLTKLKVRQPSARIQIRDARADRVLDLLVSDEVDVAITAMPSYPELVAAIPLIDEDYVVAMHPGHQLAACDAVPLTAVAEHGYLERLDCEFDLYLDARSDVPDLDWDVRYASEREDWIQALLQAGEGCAIVPAQMALLPNIVTRPISAPKLNRTVSLVTVRGRPLSEAAKLFVRLSSTHDWLSGK